jgi:hypothetical protein
LAALSTAPAVPPSRAAFSPSARAGKRARSGGSKVSREKSSMRNSTKEGPRRRGQVSAYWIGTRMSGRPICATIDPSTNSTMEWTIDCGWTATSIRDGSTSKSQRASTSSSALFMRVADSIVIFGPIDQVGCLRASSGEAAAIASLDQVRNGPPEAVRMSRRTSAGRPAESAWKRALCSLSTGRIRAPLSAAHRRRSGPAMTIDSLLASASRFPRRTASREAGSPAAPEAAETTTSHSGSAIASRRVRS